MSQSWIIVDAWLTAKHFKILKNIFISKTFDFYD